MDCFSFLLLLFFDVKHSLSPLNNIWCNTVVLPWRHSNMVVQSQAQKKKPCTGQKSLIFAFKIKFFKRKFTRPFLLLELQMDGKFKEE